MSYDLFIAPDGVAEEKQMDAWIRWTYCCNGWMWSVMQGATVLAEGCERSRAEAEAKAAQFIEAA